MIQKEIKGDLYMKKTGSWLLCAVWMGVIFIMSGTTGDVSGRQSGLIVDLLLTVIKSIFGADAASAIPAEVMGLLVRKAAHMAEYAVLFLLYKRALSLSGAKHPGITALVMSACYAATDEWHQSFVADRGPSVVDVGIDTLGASMAWGCCSVVDICKKWCLMQKKDREFFTGKNNRSTSGMRRKA